jgi:hypothetical protein
MSLCAFDQSPMKRLAVALLVGPLVLMSGCRSSTKSRSCMVNEDCDQGEAGQYQYCDGQAIFASNFYDDYFSCYQGSLGTCKPVNDSTTGAQCSTNDDCKTYSTACVNQLCVDECGSSLGNEPVLCDDLSPCPSPDALPPTVGIVQCPAGCRAGTRNWTCRSECFCPYCPAPDAASDAVDARRSSGDGDSTSDARPDVAAD